MAPKKDCSVGDVARDVGDVGESWPDDCEFCDSAVFVRRGVVGWKLCWFTMVAGL